MRPHSLALSGGIGALEELAEIMTLRYINRINKPVVIHNQGGYYDDLLRFFDRMRSERFQIVRPAGPLRRRRHGRRHLAAS